jgi:hypothetical protein
VLKKSELFSAIAAEMKRLGFKRRKSNYEYVIDLGPGFEGHCAFADAAMGEKDLLWVATFAGVRCGAATRYLAGTGEPVRRHRHRPQFHPGTCFLSRGY